MSTILTDFDLTALRVCFIPIMVSERKLQMSSSVVWLTFIGDFPADIMNILVLVLMRMALYI
jgi:hypothetical protein